MHDILPLFCLCILVLLLSEVFQDVKVGIHYPHTTEIVTKQHDVYGCT